jgi:hypothetical protein
VIRKKIEKIEIKKLQTPKLVVKAINGPGEKSGDRMVIRESYTKEKRLGVQGKSAAKLLSSI